MPDRRDMDANSAQDGCVCGSSVRLIVLDRDGVINLDSANFIKSLAEWQPIPGALEAIARLKNHGFLVAVCTNQSGVGRGLLSESTLHEIHEHLSHALAGFGAGLDDWRYCPHLPDEGCECRKPKPGMLLELMSTLGVDPAQTCFVGDSLRDMQAAQAAGCEGVLVRTGHGSEVEAAVLSIGIRRVYDDLAAFADAQIESLQHSESGLQQ